MNSRRSSGRKCFCRSRNASYSSLADCNIDASDQGVWGEGLLHPVLGGLDVSGPDVLGDVQAEILVGKSITGANDVAFASVSERRGAGPQVADAVLVPDSLI